MPTSGLARTDAFAEAIGSHLPRAGDILEIGAGEGALAKRLAAAGHRVVAIDRNPREAFAALATDRLGFTYIGRVRGKAGE